MNRAMDTAAKSRARFVGNFTSEASVERQAGHGGRLKSFIAGPHISANVQRRTLAP
jgi:hypothetical protein